MFGPGHANPIGHGSGGVAPSGQNAPAGHTKHNELPLPATPVDEPAPQRAQAERPAVAENVPTAQGTHAEEDVCLVIALDVPAGHATGLAIVLGQT